MERNIYILLFILGLKSFLVAQDIKIQKVYADSLFGAEQFYDAITEYKRLLFFSKDDSSNYEANFKIALCYKAGAKYSDAIKYLNFAKVNSTNSEDSINTEFQIVRVNILRRTIPEALQLLNNLKRMYPQIDILEIDYWSGWAYLMADDWRNASKKFAKLDKYHPLKILADDISDSKYSEVFAKALSFVIPGAGQVYTGNYFSGLMSFGWNVLWGYLTINAFITERAVEGILMGTLLWTRFYKGNLQNSEKFVIQKNVEISNNAYRYLANKYKGRRP